MQGTVKILDNSGHTAVPYDTDKGVVQEAENILVATVINRSAVFDGNTKEQVPRNEMREPGKVLEEHEELLIVPPMAGGS